MNDYTDHTAGIVLIGAGNVATHLGIALKKMQFRVVCVYNRSIDSAKLLGETLDVPYTDNLREIPVDAGLYIFSVKDDALSGLLERFPKTRGLWVHTAGSLPMQIFQPYTDRFGVLYPLQTFSRDRQLDFTGIPVFVEAGHQEDEQWLLQVARDLSGNAAVLSSEERRYYHLAAVFACNFSNHMYTLASDILEIRKLDWKQLLPLIRETASKLEDLAPKDAQTGPAVRYDRNVIEKHLGLLEGDKNKQEIYEVISNSIHSRCKK